MSTLRLFWSIVVLTLMSAALFFSAPNAACCWLDSYVTRNVAQAMGSQSLHAAQEEKIRSIAREMSITQPFIVRKMNQKAMITFGYHNAFACFPLLLNFIPINNDAYLFVSEGFLEDLSPEEQRFLIGHELIHIQEHHTQYLNLLLYSLFLLLLTLSYFLITRIVLRAQYNLPYQSYSMTALSFIVTLTCWSCSNIIGLAYRRHIEKIADYESLRRLHSYEGCLKIVDRWQKEFKLREHEPYGGLFSDHPSCDKRKSYCLALQNSVKDIT